MIGSAMNEHLRITTWPGDPIVVPPVDHPGHVDRDGEWLRFDYAIRSDHDWTREAKLIPDELYLRQARELDLADLDMVSEFVGTFGRVAPFRFDEDLPHRDWHAWFLRFSATRGRRYHPDRDRGASQAVSCHVDEVVFRLTILRALTDHAIAFREGNYEHETWASYLREPLQAGAAGEHEAWSYFTEFANAALRRFHVRVTAEVGDRDFDLGIARPTVYEACVLQLVNDLASDDLTWRHCGHCDRGFYRQVGRSTVQSRTKGVMYCSPECARAASVKAYRARKRAQREES
jgi:hypothetical protein